MTAEVSRLHEAAEQFADELVDLLNHTVATDAPIRARVYGNRFVVAGFDEKQDKVGIPLKVGGDPCLELGFSMNCRWDSSGQYLAAGKTTISLGPRVWREDLIRFDYDHTRTWARAHVNLHAESGALGYLLAAAARKRGAAPRLPKVQVLHIPVGGKRFRPSIEDVIEMAVEDLGVDHTDDWHAHLEAGRASWRRKQLYAAMRDELHTDPVAVASELREQLEEMVATLSAGS